jgi:hypothetical protein
MPELEFWFTGTALFLAVSCAFACCVAVFAVREMISEGKFRLLMMAAIVIGIFGWKTAAQQEKDSAMLRNDIRRVAERLKIDQGDQSAAALAAEILRRLPQPSVLTEDEKSRLGKALEGIPGDKRFPVIIGCPLSAALYANMVAKLFSDHGWKATPSCTFLITASSYGIGFGFSDDVLSGKLPPSRSATVLMNLFDQAKIEYGKAHFDEVKGDDYWFIVALPAPN